MMLFRFVSCLDDDVSSGADTSPVRHLPDWFPGAGFKRTAKAWYALVTDTSEVPFKYAQEAKVCGSKTPLPDRY